MAINVHIVNLKHRTDRCRHIVEEFTGRPEFSFNVVPAVEHQCGAYGLWLSALHIVKEEAEKGSNFFIFCEDDHVFTEDYSFQLLEDCIQQAQNLNADMLSGGYSWFNNAVQVSDNLFWSDIFNGTQFIVIFRKFYNTIIEANFGKDVILDLSLSSITNNKFVIHPFISVQKEFGYSDITSSNKKEGYIDKIFTESKERFVLLDKVRKYYFQ